MPATATATIDELICESVKQTDEANLRGKYSDQDEFVIVDEFLPQEVLNRWEVELETIKPHVHRNYLPGHKKGGSVAYDTVNALHHQSPAFITVHRCSDFFVALSAPR